MHLDRQHAVLHRYTLLLNCSQSGAAERLILWACTAEHDSNELRNARYSEHDKYKYMTLITVYMGAGAEGRSQAVAMQTV